MGSSQAGSAPSGASAPRGARGVMTVGGVQGRRRALKGCRPSVLEHPLAMAGHRASGFVHWVSHWLAAELASFKFPFSCENRNGVPMQALQTHRAHKTVNPQASTHTHESRA